MQGPMNGRAIMLSREELYRLAWTISLETTARELRISSRRLIKIFDELQIPYPRPSYWKRKAAGQFVFQRELPTANQEIPSQVIIDQPVERNAKSSNPPCWHPVIAEWREKRNSSMAARPYLSRTLSESELRKHKILDAIFKAVELQGVKPQPKLKRDRIYFVYGDVEINCTMREKKRRVDVKRSWSDDISFALKPTGLLIFKIEN